MENFSQLIAQLHHQIPSTFWGVVVGSLFTLTGIYLTNRATDRRSKTEREMAFRKETYTAATEAIAVSLNGVAKLSDFTYSLKEISTTHGEQAPVIAKVNLVAGEDTIRALTNYGAEFAGAYLRLSYQRMVLTFLQQRLAEKVALRSGYQKTHDAMLELMQPHNIDGVQDPRRFETLKGIFDFEVGRITTISQEIQQMADEFVAKHTPFAKDCFAESIRLNRLLIPVLVEARSELGLSISKERYAEILYQAQSKVEGKFDEFIQKVAEARAEAMAS